MSTEQCVYFNSKAIPECALSQEFPKDCPTCEAYIPLKTSDRTPCEVWTRVMGYHRPTNNFNAGKLAEHKERKFYKEK